MDPDFLAARVTGVLRSRTETTKAFLGRATHLALQGQRLR